MKDKEAEYIDMSLSFMSLHLTRPIILYPASAPVLIGFLLLGILLYSVAFLVLALFGALQLSGALPLLLLFVLFVSQALPLERVYVIRTVIRLSCADAIAHQANYTQR